MEKKKEEQKNRKVENKNSKINRVASFVSEKMLAESAYDRHAQKTSFIIYQDGEISEQPKITDGIETYCPLDPKSDFVRRGVIQLPSGVEDYGTDEQLRAALQSFIHEYVDISPDFEIVAANYILLTWIYDRFNELPYLRVIGDYGGGKSRFIQVIGLLCYKSASTSGATTPSPIFRLLDRVRGTLVLDEADFQMSDMTGAIVKILNNGYTTGFPVWRSEGKGKGVFEEKTYDVYSPKIIASRNLFRDRALESRCLTEHMRMTNRADIPLSLDQNFYGRAQTLRNCLLMWRFKNYRRQFNINPAFPDGVQARLHQILIPMLAVAEDSEKVRETIIRYAVAYNQSLMEIRRTSLEASLLDALYLLSQESPQKEGFTIKEVAVRASKISDHRDISPRFAGAILRNNLLLMSVRTRYGYLISIEHNREILKALWTSYGIGDIVNVVNNVNYPPG